MGLQWVLHCYGSVSGISPLFSLAALEYLQEGDAGFPLQILLVETVVLSLEDASKAV